MARKKRRSANENFDIIKACKSLDLADPVLWSKSAAVGLRVALIAGLVAFGYGYWKGLQRKPVEVNLDDSIIELKDAEGKSHILTIKDRQVLFDGKKVTTSNVKNLLPYGIELKPKLVGGVTSAGSPAAGMAMEVAHAYRFNLDFLATVPFVGAGISHDIKLQKPIRIDNTSIGIGAGIDLEVQEPALLVYMALEF